MSLPIPEVEKEQKLTFSTLSLENLKNLCHPDEELEEWFNDLIRDLKEYAYLFVKLKKKSQERQMVYLSEDVKNWQIELKRADETRKRKHNAIVTDLKALGRLLNQKKGIECDWLSFADEQFRGKITNWALREISLQDEDIRKFLLSNLEKPELKAIGLIKEEDKG